MRALWVLLLLLPAGAAAGDLQGRVVDDAGVPVADAEVAMWWHGYEEKPARQVVRTDAAGHFTFPDEPPSRILCASAPGRGLAVAHVRPNAARVTLRLRASRSIVGEVLLPGGGPAEGVSVCLCDAEERLETNDGSGWDDQLRIALPKAIQERFAVRTDGRGAFRLDGLPHGKLRLRVTDPRFVTELVEVTDDGPANVRLRPGCRIRGRIDGLDGDPEGWRVVAGPVDRGVDLQSTVARVGPDGVYEVSRLPPGDYHVHAVGPRGAARVVVASQASISLEQPDAMVGFRAAPGGFVLGRVVDAETKVPLAKANVVVRGRNLPPNWDYGLQYSTGADGTFRVRVPEGPAHVALTTPAPAGYLLTQQTWDVVVKEGEETPLDILLSAGKTLVGQVVDSQGKPAAGAKVNARWEDGLGWDEATAGPDGRFRLIGLPDEGCVYQGEARRGRPRRAARPEGAPAGGGAPGARAASEGDSGWPRRRRPGPPRRRSAGAPQPHGHP